jgi:hypothetical protein
MKHEGPGVLLDANLVLTAAIMLIHSREPEYRRPEHTKGGDNNKKHENAGQRHQAREWQTAPRPQHIHYQHTLANTGGAFDNLSGKGSAKRGLPLSGWFAPDGAAPSSGHHLGRWIRAWVAHRIDEYGAGLSPRVWEFDRIFMQHAPLLDCGRLRPAPGFLNFP